MRLSYSVNNLKSLAEVELVTKVLEHYRLHGTVLSTVKMNKEQPVEPEMTTLIYDVLVNAKLSEHYNLLFEAWTSTAEDEAISMQDTSALTRLSTHNIRALTGKFAYQLSSITRYKPLRVLVVTLKDIDGNTCHRLTESGRQALVKYLDSLK